MKTIVVTYASHNGRYYAASEGIQEWGSSPDEAVVNLIGNHPGIFGIIINDRTCE